MKRVRDPIAYVLAALLGACGAGPEVRYAGWLDMDRDSAHERAMQRECEGLEPPTSSIINARANSCRLFAANYAKLSEGWFHYMEEACRLGDVVVCSDLARSVMPRDFDHVVLSGYSDLERPTSRSIVFPIAVSPSPPNEHPAARSLRDTFMRYEAGCDTVKQYPGGPYLAADCKDLATLQAAFARGRRQLPQERPEVIASQIGQLVVQCSETVVGDCERAAELAGSLALLGLRESDVPTASDPTLRARITSLVTDVCRSTEKAWHDWEALGMVCFQAAMLHNMHAMKAEYVAPPGAPATTAGYPHSRRGPERAWCTSMKRPAGGYTSRGYRSTWPPSVASAPPKRRAANVRASATRNNGSNSSNSAWCKNARSSNNSWRGNVNGIRSSALRRAARARGRQQRRNRRGRTRHPRTRGGSSSRATKRSRSLTASLVNPIGVDDAALAGLSRDAAIGPPLGCTQGSIGRLVISMIAYQAAAAIMRMQLDAAVSAPRAAGGRPALLAG